MKLTSCSVPITGIRIACYHRDSDCMLFPGYGLHAITRIRIACYFQDTDCMLFPGFGLHAITGIRIACYYRDTDYMLLPGFGLQEVMDRFRARKKRGPLSKCQIY